MGTRSALVVALIVSLAISSHGQQCRYFALWDWGNWGQNIVPEGQNATSPDECCSMCKTTQDCYGWSYNDAQLRCYLKYYEYRGLFNGWNYSGLPEQISGTLLGDAPPNVTNPHGIFYAQPDVMPWMCVPNNDFNWGVHENNIAEYKGVTSYFRCFDLCRNFTGCFAWTYNTAIRECFLKDHSDANTAVGFQPWPGTIAGTINGDNALSGQGNKKKKLSVGAIAGIVVGAVLGVACLFAVLYKVWLQRKQRQQQEEEEAARDKGLKLDVVFSHNNNHSWNGHQLLSPKPLNIPGVPEAEVFLLSRQYPWTSMEQLPNSGDVQAVEAGINDCQLDQLLPADQRHAGAGGVCPTVQLSTKELASQVLLMQDGLLGRGGTALVFKCIWPSRFGPNRLLAAKVLQGRYESDIHALQSFAYEAGVLASTQHRNVIKLYGYCLEPPTLCLILELLPHSLKDLLYKSPSDQSPAIETGMMSPEGHRGTSGAMIKAGHGGTTASGTSWDHMASPKDIHTTPSVTSAGTSTAHGSAVGTSIASPFQTMSNVGTSTGRPAGAPTPPHLLPLNSSQTLSEHHTISVNSLTSPTSDHPGAPSHASISAAAGVRPITLPEIVRISTDVAAGLMYLHNLHMPANVASMAPPTATSGPLSVVLSASASMGLDDNKGLGEEGANKSTASLESVAASAAAAPDAPKGSRIVHRDLKPANILLNSQGVAKISDFGLARRHENTTIGTVNLGAGTLPYMAPELLVATKAGMWGQSATNRVDIYSLGMIMWEIVAGQPPWRGMTEPAIMFAVTNRRRPPLPGDNTHDGEHATTEVAFAHGLPAHQHPGLPQLNNIIRACWQHRELRRPTAAAVYGMLAALMHQVKGVAEEEEVSGEDVSFLCLDMPMQSPSHSLPLAAQL